VAVAFTVPATAAQVTESFDTAALASAHGWVAAGGNGSGLGFSNTSEAGSGRIVASVSGAGDPLTLDLTPANRALFDNAELNAFGIFYGLFDPATTHLADYRFDDLSYTVLPEPATGITLLPLAFLLRRRRGAAVARAARVVIRRSAGPRARPPRPAAPAGR
jgi:hypothetical protein